MTWLLIAALIWVALAVPVAVLIGRSIRLADARHAAAVRDAEANFVATEAHPAEVTEAPEGAGTAEEQWTGPRTVPFAPSRLPWGGDRAAARSRPPVVRHPVQPVEREPGARESGLT